MVSEQNGKVVNVNDATIRRMQRDDAEIISSAFSAIGWNKPISLYQRYLAEQDDGTRIGYVATVAGQFAGYVTLPVAPARAVVKLMSAIGSAYSFLSG